MKAEGECTPPPGPADVLLKSANLQLQARLRSEVPSDAKDEFDAPVKLAKPILVKGSSGYYDGIRKDRSSEIKSPEELWRWLSPKASKSSNASTTPVVEKPRVGQASEDPDWRRTSANAAAANGGAGAASFPPLPPASTAPMNPEPILFEGVVVRVLEGKKSGFIQPDTSSLPRAARRELENVGCLDSDIYFNDYFVESDGSAGLGK